jgi:hypothetical protein
LGVFAFAVGFFAIAWGTYYGEIWVAHRLAAEQEIAAEQLLKLEQNLLDKYKRDSRDSPPDVKDLHRNADHEI